MSLTHDQKRFLKKHIRDMSTSDIAKHLKVSQSDIVEYLKDHWRKDKFEKFIHKHEAVTEEEQSNQPVSLRKWIQKHWSYMLFLIILVNITYIYSLFGSFVSDDRGIIENSTYIGDITYVSTAHPFTFLRDFLYYVLFWFFGKNAFVFHMVNIFFHTGNVLLLYIIVGLISNSTVAFLTAALFGIHPITSEPVSWISGGIYSQYSFFTFAALLFFILYVKKNNTKYYIFSLISSVAALQSSDRAVNPFVILIYALAFTDIKKYWKQVAAYFLIVSVWIIHYLFRVGDRIVSVQNEQFNQDISFNPIIQIPVAITSYLKLIIWPDKLSIYHSDFIMSSFEYAARIGICIIFAGVLVYTFFKKKVIFFGLAIFIVSLLPTLTPLGISSLMAERYVYFGTSGIFFIIGYYIWQVGRIKKYELATYFIFMVLIGILAVRTFVRTLDWHNEDTLWIATGKTAQYDPVAHMNLGDMHRRHQKYADAEREFQRAIELSPNNAYAYYNLGLTYTEAGVYDEALKQYERAINISPNLWQAYQNATVTYYKLGKYDLALMRAQKAIEIQPTVSDLHANLGLIYMKLQKKAKAEQALTKAIQLDSNNEKAHAALVEIMK